MARLSLAARRLVWRRCCEQGLSCAHPVILAAGLSGGALSLARADAQLSAQQARCVAIFGYDFLTTFGCESLTTSGKHFPTASKNLCHFWLRIRNHFEIKKYVMARKMLAISGCEIVTTCCEASAISGYESLTI